MSKTRITTGFMVDAENLSSVLKDNNLFELINNSFDGAGMQLCDVDDVGDISFNITYKKEIDSYYFAIEHDEVNSDLG